MGKRLLVISPLPTHPTDAGNRARVVQLVDALGELGHEVHLLVAVRERNDSAAMTAWLGDRLHLAPYYRGPRIETPVQKLLRRLRQLFDRDARHTWNIDDWYDPKLDAEIDRLHRAYAFDAAIVVYVFFSRALERFGSDVLKVIDSQDRFTLRHRIFLERGLAPPDFFSTTQREEAKGLDRADLVLAIQDEEREFFSRICHREVITTGPLVALDPLFDAHGPRDPWNILFVGSDNLNNLDGIEAFVAETWAPLRQRVPLARLLLAGAVCKANVDADGIERLGFIPDVRSAYRQAHVVINPVRQGTGLNIKSIEALGYGMPLVSSTAGARGLDAASKEALLVADSPSDVVAAIERLYHDPSLAERLSQSALAFARDWNARNLGRLASALA